jgi:hypothetical protein
MKNPMVKSTLVEVTALNQAGPETVDTWKMSGSKTGKKYK